MCSLQGLSLMKVWETNVLQIKSDLQYIVYISHKANGFIAKLFFNINLLGYMKIFLHTITVSILYRYLIGSVNTLLSACIKMNLCQLQAEKNCFTVSKLNWE